MVVTITKDGDGVYWLKSNNADFVRGYSGAFKSGVLEKTLVENMANVAAWANNLPDGRCEECLFELEV